MNKTFFKRKTPKKKANGITTIKNKLWKVTREVVIQRDKSTCQWCKKHVTGSNRHVSHVIPKARGNIYRFDLKNLKVLCYRCHIKWHESPMESMEWFSKTFPDRAEYLKSLQHQTVLWKKEDYQKMIDERS